MATESPTLSSHSAPPLHPLGFPSQDDRAGRRADRPFCPHPARTAQHPGCIAPFRAVVALPAEAQHVPMVRRVVAAHLARWGVDVEDRESALLIVGELAANAAQHGRAEMTVRLSLAGSTVQIEVADFGGPSASPSAQPTLQQEIDEHGRGLGIVEFLAEHLDISRGSGGTRASAALRLAAEPTGSPAAASQSAARPQVTAA